MPAAGWTGFRLRPGRSLQQFIREFDRGNDAGDDGSQLDRCLVAGLSGHRRGPVDDVLDPGAVPQTAPADAPQGPRGSIQSYFWKETREDAER